MAAVARQWTIVGNTDEVVESISCYPFEVVRLADSMRRLLLAFGQILQVDEPSEVVKVDTAANLCERVKFLGHMVQYGIDEEAVTLTFLSGVGGKLAQRISVAGISDIEELAMCEADDFEEISGISRARAQRWISDAELLVKDQHALWLKEERSKAVVNTTSDWPTNVDPYRLRRALELVVDVQRPGHFVVTGGLEPHRVEMSNRRLICDCMDYSRGNLCKHILTVRLKRRDSKLVSLVRRLSRDCIPHGADLFQMWFSSEQNRRRATA